MARNHPENVNPHIGQIAQQRDSFDMVDIVTPYYTPAEAWGTGGCPHSADVLVPDLPFDFLQPGTRKQVTQAGYGGPFLIRSNPIGAIVDAIRGFCFPQPMEQVSSDGSTYSDNGYTDGSLGGDNSYYPGSGYYTAPSVVGDMMPAPTMPMDMPMPTMQVDPCSGVALAQENAKVAQALILEKQQKIAALCQISVNARACANAAGANKTLKAGWNLLADQTKALTQALGCNNCATCVQAPAPSMGGTTGTMNPTPATNGSTTMAPSTGMSPNTNTGSSMQTPANPPMKTGGETSNVSVMPQNNPFGYIGIANPVYSLFNPHAAQNIQADSYMPKMPVLPDPSSLTEGNIFMHPSADPMGGTFDPARSTQPGRTRFQNQHGASRQVPRLPRF